MKHLLLGVGAFLLSSFLKLSDGFIQRRYFYDGILFEGEVGESEFVDFSTIKREEWKNLNGTSIKHQLHGKEHFCSVGPGGWIAYPNASYSHGGSFYMLIIGELCAPAENINSIQPIGFVLGNQDATVALFSKIYFESEAKLLYNGNMTGDFKSLIYMGDEGVTVEGQGKKGKVKYCIKRSFSVDHVCVLPDLVGDLGLKSSEKLVVQHGCDFDKGNLTIFYLQTCYSEGVEVVPLELDMSLEKETKICKDSGSKDDKNVFLQVMDVWKSRILYDGEQFGTIHLKNIEAYPKVEAFLQFVDIFMMGCPSVDEHYLSLLAHIFLQHLKAVWDSNPSMIGPGYDLFYIHAFDYLSHCWSATSAVGHPLMNNVGPCGPGHSTASPQILGSFDSVIEQIFYMLNYITPYCNHMSDYTTNDWMTFPEMFKQVFLLPIEKQWMNPGVWEHMYPIMFHGYDYPQMVAQLMSCASGDASGGEFVPPISRTPGFVKLIPKKGNGTEKGDKEAPAPPPPTDDKEKSPTPEPEHPETGDEEGGELGEGGNHGKREIKPEDKWNQPYTVDSNSSHVGHVADKPQGRKVKSKKNHKKSKKSKGKKKKKKKGKKVKKAKKEESLTNNTQPQPQEIQPKKKIHKKGKKKERSRSQSLRPKKPHTTPTPPQLQK